MVAHAPQIEFAGERMSVHFDNFGPEAYPLFLRIMMYTNPISRQEDVTVLDPFMGIGSTAYIALGGPTSRGNVVNEPRNVIGFELKESFSGMES